MKIGILGAGISGLSTAHILKNKGFTVSIFEKESKPGGLIRCDKINGSLFHTCGGHIWNTKRQDVSNWFWTFFNQDKEFTKTNRNSVVFMNEDLKIPYPIENYIYLLPVETQKAIIHDLINIANTRNNEPTNFEDFLKYRFGNTLYNIYFKPYNEKIWSQALNDVPLNWLEGKLPMPTVQEILFNNFNHIKEKSFVHSTFWYEINNGSQFLADRIAEGLNVYYNSEIKEMAYHKGKWNINGQIYDKVVFCGNIKDLPFIIRGISFEKYKSFIENLQFHGTTTVFCEIDRNPYSWIYLPDQKYKPHRIICTGNFSSNNNKDGIMTGTIEFTDYVSKEEILKNLKQLPLHPQYITHKFNQYTYPIQDLRTKCMIETLKKELVQYNLFLTGRFVDWEYYNMDAAIGAAMDTCNLINLE